MELASWLPCFTVSCCLLCDWDGSRFFLIVSTTFMTFLSTVFFFFLLEGFRYWPRMTALVCNGTLLRLFFAKTM